MAGIISACEPAPSPDSSADVAPAEILIDASNTHPLPHEIAVADSALFLAGVNDTMIYVHDATTGSRISATGREGDGPGEFRSIGSLYPRTTEAGDELWVFDARLGRLTGYDIGRNGDAVRRAPSLFIGAYEGAGWLNDTTLVALPFFARHRLVLLDPDGAVRDSIGEVDLVRDGVAPSVAHEILFPRAAVRPSGGAIAVGSRFAGRIELYHDGAADMDSVHVPEPFPPVVDQDFNGAVPVHRITGQTRYGYVHLTATDDHIVALYSGRTMASCPQCAWYGDQVHVFDWHGELQDVFDLEADAIAIAVSADQRWLYAVNRDPVPVVRRYSLERATK